MTSVLTARQWLHDYVDSLSDDEAQDLADEIALWRDEPDDLASAEVEAVARAESEFERGDFVTREEFLRKHSA